MKKIPAASISVMFSVLLLLGCAEKSETAAVKTPPYPVAAPDEPFVTAAAEYTVSFGKSGGLTLTVKNISDEYPSVTVKIFVTSDLAENVRDSQISVYLDKGKSHIFALPFTADDLPLTVYYAEEHGEEKSKSNAEIKTQISGFTVVNAAHTAR